MAFADMQEGLFYQGPQSVIESFVGGCFGRTGAEGISYGVISMMAVFFADVVGQAADVEHPVATGAETELTVDTVAGHAVVEAFAKGETWQRGEFRVQAKGCQRISG